MAAYVVAVLHRTSLGVAGLEAAEQFSAGAATLSMFVVVQLVTYAGLQVPMGVLLDRIGARRMIATGAVAMAVGQLGMAVATSVGWALAARLLLGAGDAMTFVSVMRLLPAWFSPRRVPVLTQVSGVSGQLGQLLAAGPLVVLLNLTGWRWSFVGLAAVGALAAAAAVLAIRDAPEETDARPRPWRGRSRPGAPRIRLSGLRPVAREPGTWLGFWAHWLNGFPATTFLLLWGFPFLVTAQGLAPQQASLLFTCHVLAVVAAGPVVGAISARHPRHRIPLVLGIAGLVLAAWVLVLVPGRPSPMWVLVVFVAVLAVGPPGSLVGFDVARTYNPPHRLGTAIGLVNSGGFLAALISVAAIGVVLDRVAPGGATEYGLAEYRIAFATLLVPWTAGVIGILVGRHRVYARTADREL